MKKEEVKTIKYITEDGKEFFDIEQANKHEKDLMFEELKRKSIKILIYSIFKIENKDELKLLISNDYGIKHVRFDIETLTYPIYICKSIDTRYQCGVFQLLDEVIYDVEKVLNKLKNLK